MCTTNLRSDIPLRKFKIVQKKGGTFVEGDILVNEAKNMYTDKKFFLVFKKYCSPEKKF